MDAAAGTVRLHRPRVLRRPALGLRQHTRVAPRARRVEERAVRLLRRMREMAREPVEQDRGPPVGDRERVAPETQRKPEPEIRGEQRVRALARKVRSHARDPDHERVERRIELRASQRHRPQQCLRMRDRRRAAERRSHRDLGSQRAQHIAAKHLRQRSVHVAKRRARDPLHRGRVVRVAAQSARGLRMVEHERHAEQRNPPASARSSATARCQPCDAAVSSSEYAPAARSASAPAAASSADGPPCSTDSAALTTTTRSVSTSARFTRRCGREESSTRTSSGSSTSWTITWPWNRRASSGVTNVSSSRCDERRARPEATRKV